QLILSELLLKNGDLLSRRVRSRHRLPQRGASLILARQKLFLTEDRNRLSGLDAVALSEADFENAPGRFRRHGGIVALDPAAQNDDARRRATLCKEQLPEQKRGRRHHDKQDEWNDESAKARKPRAA